MRDILQPPHAFASDDLRLVLERAGLDGSAAIHALPGGRNNRVFCVDHDRRRLLLKAYFRTAGDPRDRLRQEFGFLQYLWRQGVRTAPEPLFADYDLDLALYEFIHGRTLQLDEIGPAYIGDAIRFFRAINAGRGSAEAQRLPAASEACFSIRDHLYTVDRRIERVKTIAPCDDAAEEASGFVAGDLVPLWECVRASVTAAFDRDGRLPAALPLDTRCLSPSDFGFHNALVDDAGTVRFLDFEYAGWDDPAKLICDFANQPDMLLPRPLSREFERAVVDGDPAPERLAERVRWLQPVYQIKWSCIILNDFLPFGSDRAQFTGAASGQASRRVAQLGKARRMLKLAELSFANAAGR